MVRIYIGNLSWGTTDDGLKKAFERFGEVNDANVARDRETGRSRGFGFVEMPNREQAETAIRELDGSELDGRRIRVGYEGGYKEDMGGRRDRGRGRGRPDWERNRW